MNIKEIISSYDAEHLKNKPEAHTILKRLLTQALPIINKYTHITKKDLEINSTENFQDALYQILGDCEIAILMQPISLTELLKKGELHPICHGLTPRTEDLPKKYWFNNPPTRITWHQKNGFICASTKRNIEPNIYIQIANSDIRIFPWSKFNLTFQP